MPDSVDSLYGQLVDAAVEWADNYEIASSRDERALESTFSHRTAAAAKLQEIRSLVKELHKRERQTHDTDTKMG